MEKKKIVILLPKLTAGGTERTAVVLADYLVNNDVDVSIILMFNREKFYDVNPKVKIIEPQNFRDKYGKILSIPMTLRYLRKNIFNENPDSVFCLGYILIGLIASLGCNTKVVFSGRSSPDRERFPRNPILTAFYNFLYFLLRRRVNGIIAQTNYAKKVYQKKYKCPIAVIPNFLREIKSYNHPRKNQIITLGRCSYEKGQHYLVEAFSKITASNWELVIIGDGNLLESLKQQVKDLKIHDKVHFLGFQKEVDYYLSQAKIFAFTSIIEGYPNALIEGMANGLAPVSFDCVAGPSDIINDSINGFLVPVGNINTFAQKLQLLVDDSFLFDKISTNAKLIIETNKLEYIAKKYKEFLLK